MDSNRNKQNRRRKTHRSALKSRKSTVQSSKSRKASSVKASSSFTSIAVTPSRASIATRVNRSEEAAVCGGFIWGMVGVCVLILLGGGQHVSALGFALMLPGVALLLRPPERGFGRWMDISVVGILGTLLFAFLPLFYWKTPAWRSAAVDVLEIDLPVLLTVQPWGSFEAFLSAVAGFAWLYAVGNWKVNFEGRRKIYFIISCLIAVFAVIVAAGNIYGWRYLGAGDAEAFSFFPGRNQTSNFIAIGGVLTFGYAMEGLRGRRLTHAVGLLASFFALLALVYSVSASGVLLYFGGICVWLLVSLLRTTLSRFIKIGIPLLLLVLSFFVTSHVWTAERVTESISSPSEWGGDAHRLILRDTWKMIGDAPLTGVGVGNFSAVFPQYRDLSRDFHDTVHPESDLFWLGAEGGLIAVLFLGILLVSYFMKCRASGSGRSGAYRIIALICVVIFVVDGVFDVSGHRPGTAYFAIILVALALPRVKDQQRAILKPVVWRSIGGVLVFFGAVWFLGALFGLPTHSALAMDQQVERAAESRSLERLDHEALAVAELIALRPLDWNGYFKRAQIGLLRGEDYSIVEQDFRRARFVEPNIGMVAYQEGQAWLPYDIKRVVSAWREALNRDVGSNSQLYGPMLGKAQKNEALMEEVIEMSKMEPNYRARLILSLKDALLTREIEAELVLDPSLGHFAKEDRTAILRRWLKFSELVRVEAYLDEFGNTLDSPWQIYAILRKNQARDKEAVEIIRETLTVPVLPDVKMDLRRIDRLEHGFFRSASDLAKGSALLNYYLEKDNFQDALRVVDKLLEQSSSPRYLHYWRAEILYQLEDYSESWYAFEAYLKQLKL